ncbi:hypothetical protein ALC57_16765 [Trachymyrmex cornetzi]|uniref:Uncharacterized protein n=1 Tax=Trachymyrmex cornetzi TaxID=471704 RepID=A0A151IUJ8_9HYME|nr:hypothetical protein ALC57_16765 [Trachymyrmex cornetzi]
MGRLRTSFSCVRDDSIRARDVPLSDAEDCNRRSRQKNHSPATMLEEGRRRVMREELPPAYRPPLKQTGGILVEIPGEPDAWRLINYRSAEDRSSLCFKCGQGGHRSFLGARPSCPVCTSRG